MRSWKLLVLPSLAGAIWAATPAAPAQVSVSIGAAPVCPYGYYDYSPYQCAPYGYYGPECSVGASLLEPDHGSMVRMTSTVTSITTMIHIMGITVLIRPTANTPIRAGSLTMKQRISMAQICAMGVDMKVIPKVIPVNNG